MARIDYSKRDWPEQIKRLAREKVEREARRATLYYRVKSRMDKAPAVEIQAIHDAQNGRCANNGCKAKVPVYGRGRAIDPVTHKMLCKACSVMLGIAQRSEKNLLGLVEYLRATRTDRK